MNKDNNESDGTAELAALAFHWFLHRGQQMYRELPMVDQLLFAQAAGLDDGGYLRARRFLDVYNDARQAAELVAAPAQGNG